MSPQSWTRGGREQDEAVADPLDVRDQMRGQNDGRGLPAATASASVPRKCRRASGSSAATGSSSSRTRGRLASVSASATWARWPPRTACSGMFSPRSRSLTESPSQRGFMCAPMPMWSSADSRRYSGISWARNPISARKAGA